MYFKQPTRRALLAREGSLMLDRLDPSDQAAVLTHLTGSVQAFGLGLKTKTKQGVGRLGGGRLELFVAHFAEFSVLSHVWCLCCYP